MQAYLNREQAAEYLRTRYGLKIKASSLREYARTGRGPCYIRAGIAAVYIKKDLNQWALLKRSPRINKASDLRKTEKAA